MKYIKRMGHLLIVCIVYLKNKDICKGNKSWNIMNKITWLEYFLSSEKNIDTDATQLKSMIQFYIFDKAIYARIMRWHMVTFSYHIISLL